MTSRINELSTFQRPPVKSPDPPSPREILQAIRDVIVWVWERDYAHPGVNELTVSPKLSIGLTFLKLEFFF